MLLRNVPVEPSRLCLGGAVFGSDTPKETSFELLDAYQALGGNVVDTAHIYAAWIPGAWGASERCIGEWIQWRGARNSIVLATKGAHPPMDAMDTGRCGAEDLRRDLMESLERLQVEHIDLYWLHRDHPGMPVGAIVDALTALVEEGLIRNFGASNWTTARIEEANRYAEERGIPGFAASQPGWAMIDRAPGPAPVGGMLYLDAEGRRWHEHSRLPLMPYTAQARGYFSAENTAWAADGFIGPCPRGGDYDCPANRATLTTAMRLARAKGCTAGQIAMAWLLHQPFPTFPIFSTGNMKHLEEAMGALRVSLDDSEMAALVKTSTSPRQT